MALGREGLNDHGALRQDTALQTAVGVDREVASAPTLCRLEKWADRATAWRLHEVLVDQFIASFDSAPEALVLVPASRGYPRSRGATVVAMGRH